jgi:putative aldouronate transport system substrate-binding protein
MAEVNTYISEMKLRFITGAESLDNFEKYIKEINELGMIEALEITQAALNRYLSK